ncbi:MAG: regulatory protein GemA [Proteobacteria bacterium]|nr:regulatory protein GemA [Pseudomonadota bacterium]
MKAQARRLPAAVGGERNRRLATIHAMVKEIGLQDEAYRDLLERITGHRSAALCSDVQLYQVVMDLRRQGGGRKVGGRPRADSPTARKARAMWISLHALDELEDGSERALASFVERQTGKLDLRLATDAEHGKVIDALKAMLKRAGVTMCAGIAPLEARRRVVREVWARLHKAGWARVAGDGGISGYAHATWITPNARPLDAFEGEHLDRLIALLGAEARQLKVGRRHASAGKEPS